MLRTSVLRGLAAFVCVVVSFYVASCAPRTAVQGNPPSSGPADGIPLTHATPAAAGDEATEGQETAAADSSLTQAVANGSSADSTAASAIEPTSTKDAGTTDEAPAKFDLRPVTEVTVKAGADDDSWVIEVATQTPSADWLVELRPRDDKTLADSGSAFAEFIVVGKRPEIKTTAGVTKTTAKLEVKLGKAVGTVIVTGRSFVFLAGDVCDEAVGR